MEQACSVKHKIFVQITSIATNNAHGAELFKETQQLFWLLNTIHYHVDKCLLLVTIPHHPSSSRLMLILSCHLCLSSLLPLQFLTKIFHIFINCAVCTTCTTHLILLHSIIATRAEIMKIVNTHQHANCIWRLQRHASQFGNQLVYSQAV